MLSKRNKLILLKLLSLFSVVRGYNILIILLAQYLASIFILAPHFSLGNVILDPYLLMIVLASSAVIAGGYIINNFYDKEKDIINRPQKTMLDRLVSQQTKLIGYFILNFAAVIMASYVSFKAVVFFSAYIFGIWLYSHKLKRIPFVGNVIAATLAITPFFTLFVYYKNYETTIFVHASFLFLILVTRELMKDLGSLKGDLVQNYKTIPIVYGEGVAKTLITILVLLSLIPMYLLIGKYDIGMMDFYFYGSTILLALFLVLLWLSMDKQHYVWLHNILKTIIVAGVFSIMLINPILILDKIKAI